MARFYNPYHFVPVVSDALSAKSAEPYTPSREEFKAALVEGAKTVEKLKHVTHERYVPGTHSGRLIVRLTTVTPTVIGAKQDAEKGSEHPRVHPFKIDGRPAIPASTLRGLVGSVMEAASNGPLRILENRSYSFRRKMEESLSAIGLIVSEGGNLRLKPMCLPTLESKDGGRTFAVELRFKSIFPSPQFKVFFGNRAEIRSPEFQYTTNTDPSQAVPMPVKQLVWGGNAVIFDRSLHVKANRYAVAQDADTYESGRLGMVRVLGCQGSERESMPNSKTHELWIPLPDPKAPSLHISQEAIDRFEQLADERTEAESSLPFEPKGTRSSPGDRGKGRRLRLRAGDMVYFDVDAKGTVIEVSFSSIWRGRVEDKITRKVASAWSFFGKEQRPFNPERATVSLAEQLLGFAEEFPGKTKQPAATADVTPAALALASRLSFADALLPEGIVGAFEEPVTLRILDSPKLPCPSMYFKEKNGQGAYIAKRALDPARHAGQGRKWYLHARSTTGEVPWKTMKPGNDKQKSRVDPLKAGQSFFFHVDFDNLSNIELGLLLYAIEPGPAFHHKLGMGKPLGLGTVKLEVTGYFPVNRSTRYTLEGLRAGRYTSGELTKAGLSVFGGKQWPLRYSAEAAASPSAPATLVAAREELSESKLIPQEIHDALALLGDYANAPPASAVHYPTIAGQIDK